MAYPGARNSARSNPGMEWIIWSCTSSGRLLEVPLGYISSTPLPSGSTKTWMVAVGRELDHLVLDGRTIPDAGPFDQAAIQRGLLEMGLDDVDGLLVGMGQPARDLVGSRDPGRERRRLFHVEHRGLDRCPGRPQPGLVPRGTIRRRSGIASQRTAAAPRRAGRSFWSNPGCPCAAAAACRSSGAPSGSPNPAIAGSVFPRMARSGVRR